MNKHDQKDLNQLIQTKIVGIQTSITELEVDKKHIKAIAIRNLTSPTGLIALSISSYCLTTMLLNKPNHQPEKKPDAPEAKHNIPYWTIISYLTKLIIELIYKKNKLSKVYKIQV